MKKGRKNSDMQVSNIEDVFDGVAEAFTRSRFSANPRERIGVTNVDI